jgi:REP element-mobilizing transposase RayT
MTTMSASYADLFVHLVWGTCGREPLISKGIEGRLFAAMADKCRELRCPPLAVFGMPDHVHLLVALSPAVAVSKLVKEIKGSSAHLVTHRLAPDIPFRWQGGYGAFTLRKEDTPVVRRYVLDQEMHHANRTVHPEWESPEIIDSRKETAT